MRESFCNCIKRVSRETISTGNAIPKVSSRNDKSPNNYFTAKAAVKAKTQGQGCTKQGHLRQNTLFIVPCFCGTFFSRFRFDKLESYEKMKNTKKIFFLLLYVSRFWQEMTTWQILIFEKWWSASLPSTQTIWIRILLIFKSSSWLRPNVKWKQPLIPFSLKFYYWRWQCCAWWVAQKKITSQVNQLVGNC